MKSRFPVSFKMRSSLCFVVGILCFQLSTSVPMTSLLDKIEDLRYPWGLKGGYVYAASGSSLTEFQLPKDFSFASVARAKGVWVILPSSEPTFESDNVTNWTNKATFSFSAAAQLLDHVTIRHNSGGHAVINIITRGGNHTLTPEVMASGWIAESIPVENSQVCSIRFNYNACCTIYLTFFPIPVHYWSHCSSKGGLRSHWRNWSRLYRNYNHDQTSNHKSTHALTQYFWRAHVSPFDIFDFCQ